MATKGDWGEDSSTGFSGNLFPLDGIASPSLPVILFPLPLFFFFFSLLCLTASMMKIEEAKTLEFFRVRLKKIYGGVRAKKKRIDSMGSRKTSKKICAIA